MLNAQSRLIQVDVQPKATNGLRQLTLSALTGKSPPTGPKMAIFENAYSGPKLIGDVGHRHMHCESKKNLQDFIVRDS